MNHRRCATIAPLLLAVLVAAVSVTAHVPADEPKVPAADLMRGKEAGDVRDDNGLKMKLVWCPPGAFIMGRGEPSHARTVLRLAIGSESMR